MTVWQNPNKQSQREVWQNPKKAPISQAIEQQQPKSFMNKLHPGLLGLLQSVEDYGKGFSSGLGEMEVPVPNQWKPEKIRKSESLEMGEYPKSEGNSPSFDFEQYVDEGRKTPFNIGRFGPSVLALGVTGGKSLVGAGKALTNSSIGNKIVKDANMIQGVFNKRYDDFFGKLPTKVEIPKKNVATEFNQDIPLKVEDRRQQELVNKMVGEKNIKKYKNGVDDDLYEPIKEMSKNPTIQNKHKAKTAANEAIREFDHIKATSKLDQQERAARNAAIKIKNRLVKSINKDLDKAGPEFKEIYKTLTKEYGEYMAPFLGNRDIRRARSAPSNEKYIFPKRLPAELATKSGDPFMAQLGERYPELSLNRILAGPVGKTLLSGSVGGTIMASLLKGMLNER